MEDHLSSILARKRLEVARRRRHGVEFRGLQPRLARDLVVGALRRDGARLPRVIAEIKRASPSAGEIRPRTPGDTAWLAATLAHSGAAAVSVLADRLGFGGSALDVRRAAVVLPRTPILFKEFVLDEQQVRLAAAVGASLVLLLVRALDDATLQSLVAICGSLDLLPVVEAADAAELERAVCTGALVIGVNARDLATFRVAPREARGLVENVPDDRIAVYMSGVGSAQDLHELADTRADAVLVGEGLMRADDPGARLAEWLR